MFSHLIGNLVLKDVDKRMASEAPGRCFRYVDDFVFVATEERANRLEIDLQCMLNDLGLELNTQKTEKVDSTDWLEFERSFEDDRSQISELGPKNWTTS